MEAENIINLLKQKGYKITPTRLSVIEVLTEMQNHPTAEKIYKKVSEKYPHISFATVYNTLQVLEDIGAAKVIWIDRKKARFELNVKPHSHIICKKCKRIYDVKREISLPEELKRELENYGHTLEEWTITFSGICNSCK